MLNEQNVQEYLKQSFQGRESFLLNIVFPIFGEDRFTEGFDAELLDEPPLRAAAANVGISSIVTYGKIGIDLGSIQIFDITVTDHVLLARNRVAVQGIIRRILGAFEGAFMIFHYESTDRWDWRFSFCCKGEKDVSEAKRFTFLLGPNQSCRTAAQNFVKLAQSASTGIPTMDAVRKAFDVEALSDEFFAKYKKYYEEFVKYITGKRFKKVGKKWKEVSEGVPNEAIYKAFDKDDKAVRDYVKKLLGRIVFLHFLQKKGWLGGKKSWSDGDREFMLHLYQRSSEAQKENFLDGVLEPLFDKGLDEDRSEQEDLFNTKVSGIGKVRIPYLNGGLFTRDAADEKVVRLPKEYFHDFLVFLSEYNFTIDENDPNDAEVGVDPEMLSRIFENLLEDNKDKGAIYTPKPIVEYMCRQSLIAYLQTDMPEAEHAAIEKFVKTYDPSDLTKKTASTIDKKLKSVKICDPAIGSGAFPMGMLRKLYFCRTALEEDLGNHRPAEIKRQIIQENIYGVDIEKGAVDIARLRFWLSLVVDEESPHTLPNLDFKIMQGNSLLESYKGVPLDSLLQGRRPARKKAKQGKFAFDTHETYTQDELALGGDSASHAITALMGEYYSTDNCDRKKKILSAINDQVKGYIKGQINNSDLNAEIDTLECQNDKFFLWHTWFADVFKKGGFDIVIGNPPYVKLEDIKDQSRAIEKEGYKVFTRRGDLYCIFTERGFCLLKDGGIFSFIMSNKWLQAEYGRPLRKYFCQYKLTDLVDFGDNELFKGSTVYPCIFIAHKSQPAMELRYAYMKYYNAHTFIQDIVDWQSKFPTAKLTDDTWVLSEVTGAILEKLKSRCTTLSDFISGEAYYGIKPGTTKAFIIDKNTRDTLVATDPKSEELLFRMVRGRDVQRYYVSKTPAWLIGTHNGYAETPPVDVEKYPAIKGWLNQFKESLSSRTDQGVTPFNHRDCAYWEVFRLPKIMYQKFQVTPCFVYDETGLYCNDSMWIIPTTQRALVGVLNSKMGWWLISKFCTQIKNGYQLIWKYLGKIPVPKKLPSKLTELVDEILAAKKADPKADVSALESKIDKKVFDLYGLDENERKIVMESVEIRRKTR